MTTDLVGNPPTTVPLPDERAPEEREPDEQEVFLNNLIARNADWVRRLGFRTARGCSADERVDEGITLINAVWIEACRALGRWPADRPYPQNPDGWLRGIAKHLASDNLRLYYRRHGGDRDELTRADASRDRLECEPDGPWSYDFEGAEREASLEAFQVADPDEDHAERTIEKLAAADELQRIWSSLNDRHRVAIYQRHPEEVATVFPMEVENLERLSMTFRWNNGARYKAIADAKSKALACKGTGR